MTTKTIDELKKEWEDIRDQIEDVFVRDPNKAMELANRQIEIARQIKGCTDGSI